MNGNGIKNHDICENKNVRPELNGKIMFEHFNTEKLFERNLWGFLGFVLTDCCWCDIMHIRRLC